MTDSEHSTEPEDQAAAGGRVEALVRVLPVFAWYDIWIGAYWDRNGKKLYLMIPFVGIVIDFPRAAERRMLEAFSRALLR